jgi:hypothetical protein
MGEASDMRDRVIAAAPDQRELIEARDRVANEWCRANGKDRDDLSFDDVIAIRALPEWRNAGNG